MPKPLTTNTLFYGDNLPILQEYLNAESIDLIYLDPPFNSNRDYNVLFRGESGGESGAQLQAFKDAWAWDAATQVTFEDLCLNAPPPVQKLLQTFYDLLGQNQMTAYLVMLTPRLLELHRVLKPTGSLYLHCDPTASHYLKLILDTIFGAKNFRNEVCWERSQTRSSITKVYRRAHDVLFFYTKAETYTFNPQFKPLSKGSQKLYTREDAKGKYQLVPLLVSGQRGGETGQPWRGIDPNKCGRNGMHWVTVPRKLAEYEQQGLVVWPKKEGGQPRLKYYLEESPGVPLSDLWHDISLITATSKEALGYPTQKPLALLERIIQASSNEGDWILDPFCGCGTALVAAQKLQRKWVGIDLNPLTAALHQKRLEAYEGCYNSSSER